MKVAVASQGDNLEAQMDSRFGRCAYFVVVDTDTMEFEAFENTAAQQSGGAGSASHFIDVFKQADVDGALAATVFHNNKVPIPALKQMLSAAGIGVRL